MAETVEIVPLELAGRLAGYVDPVRPCRFDGARIGRLADVVGCGSG